MKIAVFGGDMRNAHLYDLLKNVYGDVDQYALGESCGELKNMNKYDVIIGPIPFSRDGRTLYTPNTGDEIGIDEFIGSIKDTACLIAGTLPVHIVPKFKYYDLVKDEELYRKNLVPTCEGVLQVLLNNTDYTLDGSRILVAGYGKVGREISAMLKNLKGNVCVYSIDKSEIEEINRKYKPVGINDISIYDIIINTVPEIIFTGSILADLTPQTLLLDVASFPGGFDPDVITKNKLNYIHASGLPGKKAPKTVAEAMKDAVVRIIGDLT